LPLAAAAAAQRNLAEHGEDEDEHSGDPHGLGIEPVFSAEELVDLVEIQEIVHRAYVVDAMSLRVKKYSLTNSPRPFFSKLPLELLRILNPKAFLYKGVSAECVRQRRGPTYRRRGC
jgi:hypothetical protein